MLKWALLICFSLKKFYAYFGLDLAVKQPGKFTNDKVHMSKRGSSLARRILHMAALNNIKLDNGTKKLPTQLFTIITNVNVKVKKGV